MEELDLYGDLELLHEEEKQKNIEDLKWKDKYQVALTTIERLQSENKDLNKKIKLLETNFASLFDTARTEIKRKDNQICELRKQKDDICFRRTKPQHAGRQYIENDDVHAASSESVHVNPFSRQPRKDNPSSTEIPKRFPDDTRSSAYENGKRKHDKGNYRETAPRDASQERDQSRDTHRDRSRDRSRHRKRSKDSVDERSRYRFDDRYDAKHGDRSKDRKYNQSKERFNDEKNDSKKRKRHGRSSSKTKSPDCSWNKNDELHPLRMNSKNEKANKTYSNSYELSKHEEKPRDACKSSSDQTKDQTIDSKLELNQLKNVSPNSSKRVNSKIEILQIEILKDVKEFKKGKIKADKAPKPDPIDPAVAATQKSNQFLEALFDDSVMNAPEEPNLYDDLSVSTQQNSQTEDLSKEDDNCRLNLATPQRQSNLMDDLFGPSPAGSLCSVVKRKNSIISLSSSESDFVLISKQVESQKEEITQLVTTPNVPFIKQTVIDDSCSQNDKTINKTCSEMKPPTQPVAMALNSVVLKQTNSYADQMVKIDENCNFKQETPQNQLGRKFLSDHFTPPPRSSSFGENANALYFEPNTRSKNLMDEEKQTPTPQKTPIVIDDSSNDITDDARRLKVKETNKSVEENVKENIVNTEPFTFVELDSSFYSSEDEINSDLNKHLSTSRVEVESPPFESITPLKKVKAFETKSENASTITTQETNCVLHTPVEKFFELNCSQPEIEGKSTEKYTTTFQNDVEQHNFEEVLHPKNRKESKSTEKDEKREELCSKACTSNLNAVSDEKQHRSKSSRSENEKRRHDHHHHHRKHNDRSKKTRLDSSKKLVARKHCKYVNLTNKKNVERKSFYSKGKTDEVSKDRFSPILVYYDDDTAKNPSQNQKGEDEDQVFFLHCDDISSDDEFNKEESYSIGNKKKSKDIDESNTVQKQTLDDQINKKVLEIEESKAEEKMNSSQHNSHVECNAVLIESELENQDLILSQDEKETSSGIDENQSDAVCGSTDLVENIETNHEITFKNDNTITFDQGFSEDFSHSGNQQFPEVIAEHLKNEFYLIESETKKMQAEANCLDIENGKAEPCKNNQILHESLNKAKQLNSTQSLCSLEVDLGEKAGINAPVDRDNIENILQSDCVDEICLNTDTSRTDFVKILTGEKPPNEELDICSQSHTSSESSSNVHSTIEPVELISNSELETTNLEHTNSVKMSVSSSETYGESEFCNENAFDQKRNEMVPSSMSDQTVSQSTESLATHSPLRKSFNSADEMESCPSYSGRRKKIKTPRKHTDVGVCMDGTDNKQNEVNTPLSEQFDSNISSSEIPFSPEKDTHLPQTAEPEVDLGSGLSNQPVLKENCDRIPDLGEEHITTKTVFENGTEKTIYEVSEEEKQKLKDENIPESSSKEIIYDVKDQETRNSRELPESDKTQIECPSNTLIDEKQQQTLQKVEENPQTALPSRTMRETQVNNIENILRELDTTENLHEATSMSIQVEKEQKSEDNLSAQITESKEIKDTIDKTNEKVVESYSITIKRNRSKKKNTNKPIDSIKTISIDEKNQSPLCVESPQNPKTFNQSSEVEHTNQMNDKCNYLEKSNDDACGSSATLMKTRPHQFNEQHQPNEEHQMMKHFMDSEHSLVGTCNYPSTSYSDEVPSENPKEKTVKKRKLNNKTLTDNSDCDFKSKATANASTSEIPKPHNKRRYRKKTAQILDSSNSTGDDDVSNKSLTSNDVASNEQGNYPSTTNPDEAAGSTPEEKSGKKKRGKGKTTLDNSTETCDSTNSNTKRKYTKKSTQILDTSKSNEDVEVTSTSVTQELKDEKGKKPKPIKSAASKEPRKKRNCKKSNLNSSLNTTNESNELCEGIESCEHPPHPNQLELSICSEETLENIQISQPTVGSIDEISQPSRQAIDPHSESPSSNFPGESEEQICNNSPLNKPIDCPSKKTLSAEEETQYSCSSKHKKAKKQRKRKLSRSSSETKSEEIIQTKKSKNTHSPTKTCDTTSSPISEKNHQEPIKQTQPAKSPSLEDSITLTPTYHTIFLNDVFPNDPPPVYNAHDDDLQYHEIDDRLRCMFQSPSYPQSSNGEFPTDKINDEINATSEENVTVEETFNQSENMAMDYDLDQSERTKCDTSTSSRKVSLGSNEYVIESVGSHTANVFITRKKSKKRTKVVATVV